MQLASALDADLRGIWQDVLSQAVTGEHVGMLNYMTLIELHEGVEEKVEALEHATSERAHARAFRAAARELGIDPACDASAVFWNLIRSAFVARARSGDLLGCVIAQEVMLESFAVATYRRVGEVAPGRLGQVFARIAVEEAFHVDHALAMLKAARARDPEGFDATVHAVHLEVMTVLARMVAREKPGTGHCGLCHGSCVKPSLPRVGLDRAELRGLALRQYLTTLDEIGVPGEASLEWVARLPV